MSKPINWATNKPKVNSTEPTDLIAGKFGSKRVPGYIKAEDLRGYKVYSCLLTQTGTNAPTEETLINELGLGTITWSYSAVGNYLATLPGLYDLSTKVSVLTSPLPSVPSEEGAAIDYVKVNNNSFRLKVQVAYLYAFFNDKLDNTLLEIRVYP
jgi:hypothetical protein